MLKDLRGKLLRSAKPIETDPPMWPSFRVRAPELGVDIPVVNKAGPNDDPEAGPFEWNCCQASGVHGSSASAIEALRAHIASHHTPDPTVATGHADDGDNH